MNPISFRLVAAQLLVPLVAACSLSASKGVEGSDESQNPVEIRIGLVGDTMLDASARRVLEREGYDYAFAGSRELYVGSEIVLANLEGPLTVRGTPFEKKYTFRSPLSVAEAIRRAGINAMTLANNHSLDFGAEGLSDTIDTLDNFGIGHFGGSENLREARAPLIMTVNGVRVGMLGYSLTFPEDFWATADHAGTAFGHREWIVEDVRALKKRADIVLVSFHWGQEGKTSLREYQEILAHAAIDAGADAVIGHHPHIAQAVERYRGKAIIYSLGNYIFGSYSNRVQYGLIGELMVSGRKVVRLKLTPIDVNNFRVQFSPVALTGEALEQALDQMQALSSERKTVLERSEGTLQLKLE